MCFGVYSADNEQVGFARVVTDNATFAYLADVFGVVRISVQLGQRIRRVGILAAVLDDTVIIDDVVQSRSECATGLAGSCGVVVLGRISLGEADKCN